MNDIPSIPLTMENLHHLRSPITLTRGYCMMLRDGRYGPVSQEQQDIQDKLLRIMEEHSRFLDSFMTGEGGE